MAGSYKSYLVCPFPGLVKVAVGQLSTISTLKVIEVAIDEYELWYPFTLMV